MTARITGYGVGGAKIPLAPIPIKHNGVPASKTSYTFGQLIQNSATGNWYLYAGGSTFDLLTTSSGTIVSVLGTANQITATNVAGVVTLSIPSTFIAPGSIASTTTLTGGTGITATTGNIVATAGAVNAGTTMTAGTGITATTGNVTATAGAVNAGTSMTATLGNITATNGNVVLNTAGNKLVIATGSNASVGTSGVMSGTPGAVTVATTASSATAKIFYSRAATGGTPGQVSITAQDGTGFTLTSTGNETSTFNWWIINA